jgi:hypothetical protein
MTPRPRFARCAALATLLAARAEAAEVTWLGADEQVYVTLAPGHGLKAGDVLTVQRGGRAVATLRVEAARPSGVRAKRAGGERPRVGDAALLSAPSAPAAAPTPTRRALRATPAAPWTPPSRPPWVGTGPPAGATVAGATAWQATARTRADYGVAGLGAGPGAQHHTGLSTTLDVTHRVTGLSWHHFASLHTRSGPGAGARTGSLGEPRLHVQRAVIAWDGPSLHVGGGRLVPAGASRLGAVDGVEAGWAMGTWLRAGVFGGLAPAADALSPDARAGSAGAFLRVATPPDSDAVHRLDAGIAGVGSLRGDRRERTAVALDGRYDADHPLRPAARGAVVVDFDPVDRARAAAEVTQAWLRAELWPADRVQLALGGDTWRPAPSLRARRDLDAAAITSQDAASPRAWRGEAQGRVFLGPEGAPAWHLGVAARVAHDAGDGVAWGGSLDVESPPWLDALHLRPAIAADAAIGPLVHRLGARASLRADPVSWLGFDLTYAAHAWRHTGRDDTSLTHRAGLATDVTLPWSLSLHTAVETEHTEGTTETVILVSLGHKLGSDQ